MQRSNEFPFQVLIQNFMSRFHMKTIVFVYDCGQVPFKLSMNLRLFIDVNAGLANVSLYRRLSRREYLGKMKYFSWENLIEINFNCPPQHLQSIRVLTNVLNTMLMNRCGPFLINWD